MTNRGLYYQQHERILKAEDIKYIKRPKLPPEKVTIALFRGLPLHLRTHFKAFCIRKGVSMQAMIIHLIKQICRDDMLIIGTARSRTMKLKGQKPCNLFVRDVPKKMFRKFKAICALRGVKQTDMIAKLMEECIDIWNELVEKGARL